MVDTIASWGMNVIRVGWMWTGFEPEQDAFNMTYLEMQMEVVDRLAAAGSFCVNERLAIKNTRYMW